MARQIPVTLPQEIEAAVEAWRLGMAVPPSRSAAMAALVVAGLRAVAPDLLLSGLSGAPSGAGR